MALCVFGSTLATYVEGQGYRAASETHKEAEEQIIDADGDLLTDIAGENQAPSCCGLSNWHSRTHAGPFCLYPQLGGQCGEMI